MWDFASVHYWMFFALAVIAMLVIRSIFVNFARALTAWGTKHCGTCACHSETGDDDHAPEEDEP